MWFILFLIGLYMCIPIFDRIVSDKRILRYFLLLSFLFTFVIPTGVQIVNHFAPELFVKGVAAVNKDITGLHLFAVSGYAFYFLSGYYFSKTEFSKKERSVIYLLGILGFAATFVLGLLASLKTGQQTEAYYTMTSLNVLFEAVSVYVWFQYRPAPGGKAERIITTLSGYALGAYLIHPFFISAANKHLHLTSLSYSPLLSVPCNAILIFAVSFLASGILNHIPFVKKYLV